MRCTQTQLADVHYRARDRKILESIPITRNTMSAIRAIIRSWKERVSERLRSIWGPGYIDYINIDDILIDPESTHRHVPISAESLLLQITELHSEYRTLTLKTELSSKESVSVVRYELTHEGKQLMKGRWLSLPTGFETSFLACVDALPDT